MATRAGLGLMWSGFGSRACTIAASIVSVLSSNQHVGVLNTTAPMTDQPRQVCDAILT